MNVPQDLRYTREHEWIRLEDDGKVAVVGITDFAQHELGDIVFVEMEPVGSRLEKDAVFGTVEAVKTVAELFMPVDGSILEINEALDGAPESVNTDPYGAGWMIKISIDDPSQTASLLTADAYAGHIEA